MADVRSNAELDRIIVACLRTRPEEDFFSHYAATRIEELEAALRRASLDGNAPNFHRSKIEINLEEIVKQWLRANGYDGLWNEAGPCGCGLDDFVPCTDGPCPDCFAAYRNEDGLFYPASESRVVKYWMFRAEDEGGTVRYLDARGQKCGYDDQEARFVGTDPEAARECDRRVQLWEAISGLNGVKATYESHGIIDGPAGGNRRERNAEPRPLAADAPPRGGD